MRAPALAALIAVLLAGVLAPAPSRAEDAAPARAYAAADLEALVRGLGYASIPLEGGGRGFTVARSAFTMPVQAFVSGDGGRLLVYAPLKEWADATLAPEAVLLGLLRKNGEVGPSRFYIQRGRGKPWVGLLRSVDNRAVEPLHVRQVLDEMFDQVRATEDLWNPERWQALAPGAPAAQPAAMEGDLPGMGAPK